MKPIRFSKLLGQSRTLRSFRLALAAPALVLTLATAQAGTPTTPTAPAEPEPASNWVSFTIGGAFVDGNNGAMQTRTQTNGDFYGGIDSLHYSQAIDKSTTVTLDGHAMPGLDDYEFKLDITKANIGYVKLGFKEFRTWYEPTGGFVPGVVGGWIPLFGTDADSIVRGEASIEAGLRIENFPEITLGYTHSWRNGTKDSTEWGRSGTLLPPATGNTYNILPTLNLIDETRDAFYVDVTHTLGNTDLALGLRYEHNHNNDALYMYRDPFTVATGRANIEDYVTDTDMFSGHISSQTRINERMLLSFGYVYDTMSSSMDGSARYTLPNTGLPTALLDNGPGHVTNNTANANFWWNPIDDLVVVPSFRAGWEADSVTNLDGATNLMRASNDSTYDQLNEELEIRYTGIENVLLYAKAGLEQDTNDCTLMSVNNTFRMQTSDINLDKYQVGANWYPRQGLSVSAQYNYAKYTQKYDDSFYADTSANAFDAELKEQGYDTNDLCLRVTWRAMPNLTLVTRYDYTLTTYQNQAFLTNPGVPQVYTNVVDSADITRQIFSESVTWMPMDRMYVQATASWVFAQTNTPANDYNPSYIADSNNNYFTGALTTGYAIDNKTDITATVSYYGCKDYSGIPFTSTTVNAGEGPVGYGFNTQEFDASVTLRRRINENMTWNLRYAYINSNTSPSPDQTGGYNDFSAQMISTGLQIRF